MEMRTEQKRLAWELALQHSQKRLQRLKREHFTRAEGYGWVPDLLSDAVGGILLEYASRSERFVGFDRPSRLEFRVLLQEPEAYVVGSSIATAAGQAIMEILSGHRRHKVTRQLLDTSGEREPLGGPYRQG